VQSGHAPVGSRPATSVVPGRGVSPRPRSWRLAPNSPFHLVAEGLHDAELITLGQHQVLCSRACSGVGQSLSLWLVEGETFAEHALPDSPAVSTEHGGARGYAIAGTWPNNLVVLVKNAHKPDDPSGREGALLQWNGSRWNEMKLSLPLTPPAQHLPYLPYALLPWHDGAVLVAQSRRGERHGVEPFFVVGRTSQPAPDFSRLEFPPESEELPSSHVDYGTLATGEPFVLHHALFRRTRRSIVSLARSTKAGAVRLDTVIDVAHSVDFQFVTGQLDSRSVLVVYGENILGRTYQPWLRIYDATSEIEFGPAAKLAPGRDPVGFWLAGDKLWLHRGEAILRLDPDGWHNHAKLPAAAAVAPVPGSAAFWANEQGKASFFDETGTRHDVPWLTGEGQPIVAEIKAFGTHDIWLTARTDEGESLVFRTRTMKSLLTCQP
jgi:hypothetical protein